MIYTNIFLVGTGKDLQSFISDNKMTCCIRVSPDELVSQKAVLLETFLQSPNPLGICLDLRNVQAIEETGQNKVVQTLALFTFCVSYLRIRERAVVCFLKNKESNSRVVEWLSKLVIDCLKTQGHEEATIYQVCENRQDIQDSGIPCLLLNISETVMQAEHFEFSKDGNEGPFFFSVNSFSEAGALYEYLMRAERKFAVENSSFYEKMIEVKQLRTERDQLYSENIRLAFEKENNEISLGLLRKDAQFQVDWFKNENEVIKQWYHKEYESLPMWYKRIGHLLKRIWKTNKELKS